MDLDKAGSEVNLSPEVQRRTVTSDDSSSCLLQRISSSGDDSKSGHTPTVQQARDAAVPRSTPVIPRQLFPLFYTARSTKARVSTSPPSSNRKRKKSSDDTPLKPKSRFMPKCTLMQNKENKEQLYLDVGQKKIGHVTCPVCHMVYTYAEPKDQVEHCRFHKKLTSTIQFDGWKHERVVEEFPDGRILMVLPTDQKKQLQKVNEISQLIERELGCDTAATAILNPHLSKTFLYISNLKKVVGCVVAEKIEAGYRAIRNNSCCHYTSAESEQASLGIRRLWVFGPLRRQGLAVCLLDAVRHNFVYGRVIPKQLIAFSNPTPDGKKFASSYTGTEEFLVYR